MLRGIEVMTEPRALGLSFSMINGSADALFNITPQIIEGGYLMDEIDSNFQGNGGHE